MIFMQVEERMKAEEVVGNYKIVLDYFLGDYTITVHKKFLHFFWSDQIKVITNSELEANQIFENYVIDCKNIQEERK